MLSGKVTIQYSDAKISWNIFSMFVMAVGNAPQSLQKLYSLKDGPDDEARFASGASALKIKYICVFEEFRSMNSSKEYHEHLSLLFYVSVKLLV